MKDLSRLIGEVRREVQKTASAPAKPITEAEEIREEELPANIAKAISPLKSKLGLKVLSAWEGIHGHIVEFEVAGQQQGRWRLSTDDYNLIGKTKGLRWVEMDAETLTLGL